MAARAGLPLQVCAQQPDLLLRLIMHSQPINLCAAAMLKETACALIHSLSCCKPVCIQMLCLF